MVILFGVEKRFFCMETICSLLQQWKSEKTTRGVSHEYVWKKEQFDNVASSTEYLLGKYDNDFQTPVLQYSQQIYKRTRKCKELK